MLEGAADYAEHYTWESLKVFLVLTQRGLKPVDGSDFSSPTWKSDRAFLPFSHSFGL